MQSWILVGMMGSGKSAVGRSLAKLSGREFVDTDQMLQNKLGRNIPGIFATYGEDAFRGHETAILRELQPNNNVLSTGGGIVLREENWREMKRLGITLYLHASPETLKKRLEISKRKRPLLQVDDWEEKLESLLMQREELYQMADLDVKVDGLAIDEAAQAVFQAFQGAMGA